MSSRQLDNVEMAAPSSGPNFSLGSDDSDADQSGRTNPQPTLGNQIPASNSSLQPSGSTSAIVPGHPMRGTQPQALAKVPSKHTASRQEQEMEQGRNQYDAYMRKLRSLWTDNIDLTISYRDLAYNIPVPVTDPGVPNLAKSLLNFFTLKFLRTPTMPFLALQPTSGIQRPGQMTLVLAPPGHGNRTSNTTLALACATYSARVLHCAPRTSTH